MTAWQYAQLTIARDIRAGQIQTILWRGPGQGLGENFTDSGQSVLELLNRVGADGWEMADREEREERADGPKLLGSEQNRDDLHLQEPGPGLASEATASPSQSALPDQHPDAFAVQERLAGGGPLIYGPR